MELDTRERWTVLFPARFDVWFRLCRMVSVTGNGPLRRPNSGGELSLRSSELTSKSVFRMSA